MAILKWSTTCRTNGQKNKSFLYLAADLLEYAQREEAALELLVRGSNAPFPPAPTTTLAVDEHGAIENLDALDLDVR